MWARGTRVPLPSFSGLCPPAADGRRTGASGPRYESRLLACSVYVSANQPLTPLNLSVLSVKRGNNNNNTVLLRDVWGEKMHMEAFRKI